MASSVEVFPTAARQLPARGTWPHSSPFGQVQHRLGPRCCGSPPAFPAQARVLIAEFEGRLMRCAGKRLRKRVLIQRGGAVRVHWEWHNYPSALYLVASLTRARRAVEHPFTCTCAWVERARSGG